jgi:bacteriorhodopsin
MDPVILTKTIKKKHPISPNVKFSFYITYVFLMTTATVTFIESIRTNNPGVRHVLNLETAVSLIAGYFYSTFLDKLSTYEKEDKPIDWSEITINRYIDWSMTTPIMLLVLSLVLSSNINKVVPLSFILVVILLNYLMLYIGYIGETGQLDRKWACGLGFIPFIIMFALIYRKFVLPVYNLSNNIIFGIFVGIWLFYGVFYMMDKPLQNIGLNTLDCLAKCCFGLGLWAYFTKIIVLRPITI